MADKEKKQTRTRQRIARAKEQVSRTALGFFFGDILSSATLARYKFTIALVMILLMVYITLKYECQTHMETIAKLKTELSIIKSESIREQSTYKSRTRESTMQHLIDSLNLELRPQQQPPYILSYDKRK